VSAAPSPSAPWPPAGRLAGLLAAGLWIAACVRWFDPGAAWRPAWLEALPALPLLALAVAVSGCWLRARFRTLAGERATGSGGALLLVLLLALLFRLPLAVRGAAGYTTADAALSGIVSQTFEKAGGVDTVAEILNLADRSTEKGIMEGLEAEDPDLVESIRRLMFVFEDILLVNDKGIQSVLKEVENEVLSLALKTASEELKQKIFKNMSERAAQLIQEDMQFMGPVRVSDVEQAQQKIVDVVRRLEDAGEIIIAGRGGEKEMVV
jgi:hypothetical protein